MSEENDEATPRIKERDGETPPAAHARQERRDRGGAPMPGEANPTSDPEGRPLDRRTHSP